jgi:hypothetical protein
MVEGRCQAVGEGEGAGERGDDVALRRAAAHAPGAPHPRPFPPTSGGRENCDPEAARRARGPLPPAPSPLVPHGEGENSLVIRDLPARAAPALTPLPRSWGRGRPTLRGTSKRRSGERAPRGARRPRRRLSSLRYRDVGSCQRARLLPPRAWAPPPGPLPARSSRRGGEFARDPRPAGARGSCLDTPPPKLGEGSTDVARNEQKEVGGEGPPRRAPSSWRLPSSVTAMSVPAGARASCLARPTNDEAPGGWPGASSSSARVPIAIGARISEGGRCARRGRRGRGPPP